MRGQRILVTGAGGYVGSRLVPRLVEGGAQVTTASKDPIPPSGGEDLILDLSTDAEPLRRACESVDSAVHLAGSNEVKAAADPAGAMAETTAATQLLSEAAAAAGVRRIVYMSTIHVYGLRMQAGAVLEEEMRPEPVSTYAISRLACERVLAGLAEAEGIEVVVLRLTNSVGAPAHPGIDRWTLLVNDLCRRAAVEGRMVLRSAGVQWRDFVPLSDVCDVVAAATGGAVPAGLYNLGAGTSVTVREVAERTQAAFEREMGQRPELVAPPLPRERPDPYRVSVDRLAAAAGLRPQTSLDDALAETAAFCHEHREELAREEVAASG